MKGSKRRTGPLYPKAACTINLDTDQANAFWIIGAVRKAMKEAGAPARAANNFNVEATRVDYNHLLDTADKYVKVTWIGRDPRVFGERG